MVCACANAAGGTVYNRAHARCGVWVTGAVRDAGHSWLDLRTGRSMRTSPSSHPPAASSPCPRTHAPSADSHVPAPAPSGIAIPTDAAPLVLACIWRIGGENSTRLTQSIARMNLWQIAASTGPAVAIGARCALRRLTARTACRVNRALYFPHWYVSSRLTCCVCTHESTGKTCKRYHSVLA